MNHKSVSEAIQGKQDSDTITFLKFKLTAGMLIRKDIRSTIESACQFYNIPLNITERKGFLQSYFVFEFKNTTVGSIKKAFKDIRYNLGNL